jgi:hypothetical protein
MTMNRKRRTPPLIMIHAPFGERLKLMSGDQAEKIRPPNSVPTTMPTPPVSTVLPGATAAVAVSSAPAPAK